MFKSYDRRKLKVALWGVGGFVLLQLLYLCAGPFLFVLAYGWAIGYLALMCFEPYFSSFNQYQRGDLPEGNVVDLVSESNADRVYRVYTNTLSVNPSVGGTRVRFTYIHYNWLLAQLFEKCPKLLTSLLLWRRWYRSARIVLAVLDVRTYDALFTPEQLNRTLRDSEFGFLCTPTPDHPGSAPTDLGVIAADLVERYLQQSLAATNERA